VNHEEILKKIATSVKVANGVQTTKDYADALNELDVNLPFRKRADVEKQKEEEKAEIEAIEAIEANGGPSNLIRNLLIGGGLGAAFLFFHKRSSSQRLAITKTQVSTGMMLSPSFSLSEFLVSSAMPEIKFYTLSKKELSNVTRLAGVLQDVRDGYGKPIFINSGGRPSALTARSGEYKGHTLVEILREKGYSPSAHSQHMDFSAADFTVENKEDLVNIFKGIITMKGPITQAIIYVKDGVPDFIHLGVVSDVEEFSIKEPLLIAEVKGVRGEDGRIKNATKFIAYDPGLLDEMVA
jgi:hypothetical protein